MRHLAPHEVADAIAATLEALAATGEEARRAALDEAAKAARALYPPKRDEMPIVLVTIDDDSRLEIRQSEGVLVGYVDRREAHDAVVILPRPTDPLDIESALAGRHLVSAGEDHRDIAARTLARIARRDVVVAGAKLL